MYDLIVIGAGPGGYEAAAHAARMGKRTALFDEKYIGGTCLNVGCIPTKTFLHAAKLLTAGEESGGYGVNLGQASLDMQGLQRRKAEIVKSLTGSVEKMLRANKVEIIKARAELTADKKVKADGKTYEANNILIATGSRPAVPPIAGIDGERVLDSTGALLLEKVPGALAVIGGGVIGLEFACFLAEAGCQVTVIEMLPSIAAGIDAEMAGHLLKALLKKGISFHLEAKVTQIKGNTVRFTGRDGKEQSLSADYILNATGRRPVVEGVGLEAAGVAFDGQGIKTGETGRTNVSGVWAAGDVTGRLLLAHVAVREGIVAVNNMFGIPDVMRYSAIPSVIYTHPEAAGAGLTEEQLKQAGTAYAKAVMPMAIAGRYLVEEGKKPGYVKVLAGKEYGEILGVHAIGGPVSEIIYGAAVMIEMEMCVDDVKQIVFPHPTISEALKETVNHMS